MNGETSAEKKCLTDGNNFLWVHIKEGFITGLTRYMPNGDPRTILVAISEAFDTDIFSEYEPQYWGFDTEEEWDEFQNEIAREHDDEFYADLKKFLSDEPHGFRPGTVGECEAHIAKQLVNEDAGLIMPERRNELLEKVRAIYERDCATVVTLSEEEIAFVRSHWGDH